MAPIWEVKHIAKEFTQSGYWWQPKQTVHAVQDVSLYQDKSETLGIVGESGCGKSTLGLLLMGVHTPTSGSLYLDGKALSYDTYQQQVRSYMQMVFQNPYASLQPRMTIRHMLEEPLQVFTKLSKGERKDRVDHILHSVGLAPSLGERYAHEFSGGQRQRIAIGRALLLQPQCIICDEPISALDVSVQVQIMTLLERLQAEEQLSYVFISHDLSMVRYISHRIGVMYLGALLEVGPADALYDEPWHPYTQALLSVNRPVVPEAPIRLALTGEAPNPIHPPMGCLFSTRCPYKIGQCVEARPPLVTIGNRQVACWQVQRR